MEKLEDAFPGNTLGAQTKRWWKKREAIGGPLGFDPASVKPFGDAKKLSPKAPEGPLPALHLRDVRGCPVLLMVESDAIVALHHDATLYEVADALAPSTKTPSELAAALAKRSSVLSLKTYLALAEGLASWPDLEPKDLHPGLRLRRLSELGKWKLSAMAKALRTNPTAVEFLALDELLLDDLVAGEKKLTKAKKGGERIDLAYAYLQELPPLGAPRRVVLDGNPTLDEATTLAALAKLEGLETLSIVDCGFDAERVAAALPGVRVRTGGEGVDAKLRALAEDPEAVTTVDLSNAGSKKLPAIVPSFVNLESIELADNPGLDMEAALKTLATLPKLRHVGFRRCDLEALPTALLGLSSLESLDLAFDYGGRGNRFHDMDAKIEALRVLPRLRDVDLGSFSRGAFVRQGRADELPILSQLEHLAFEAKGYAEGLSEVFLWLTRLPALRSLDVLADEPALAPTLTQIAGLRRLRLRGKIGREVDALAAAHPDLEELAFEWHQSLPEWEERKTAPPLAFPPSIRGLKNLRRLEVIWGERSTSYGVQVEPPPEWLAELRELRHVRIEMYERSAWKHVPPGLLASPHLERLEVLAESVKLPLPEGLDALPLKHLDLWGFAGQALHVPPTLEFLRAQAMPVTGVAACVGLREATGQFAAEEIAAIAALPSLESLSGAWTEPLSHPRSNLRRLDGTGPVGTLPKLESFRVYGDLRLEGELPALTSLSWMPGVRCADWASQIAPLAKLPNLRRFSIDNHWPKPAVLPEAFRALTQLDELRFFSTSLQRLEDAKATLQEWLPDTKIVFG